MFSSKSILSIKLNLAGIFHVCQALESITNAIAKNQNLKLPKTRTIFLAEIKQKLNCRCSLMSSLVYTCILMFSVKKFIRPSLRRDVLWYTNVRLSVRPSVSHVTL
jgi:Ran GTPase-activating protein (RanGAP) involved in mRNA processing and transport